ncbi:MAG: amidohydrolase [Chloroflexi bacterium]|nr:amidohydrolase [Chloroflexota bacterium]
MASYNIVSGDSHVTDPADLWTEGLPKEFRARAPRIVKDPPGETGDMWVCEDLPHVTASMAFFAGASRDSYDEFESHIKEVSYRDGRPGGYDPAARLEDMKLDGTEAEVMYPSYALTLYRLTDAPLQRACFSVYNDWLAQFCSYDPRHLVGLGLVSIYDVEEAVAEVKRCASMGLKGVVINSWPSEGHTYENPMYDPLWATAQDLGMPISLHAFTGFGPEDSIGQQRISQTCLHHAGQRTLAHLIFWGVLDRFPNLRFVLAEMDIGWIPHYFWLADDKYRMRQDSSVEVPDMKPSDYFERNIFACFMDDPIGVKNTDLIGKDNYIWANDYPHWEGTWPKSHEYIERNFQGVSQEIRRKITRDNVIRLYDMDLDGGG